MRTLLLCLFVSTAAAAQSASLLDTPSGRGLLLPPTSPALVDDATALRVNPAALTAVSALELFYAHEWRRSSDAITSTHGAADGLYVASRVFGIGVGVAAEWVGGPGQLDTRRITYGVGVGGSRFSLGAGLSSLYSAEREALNDDWVVELGLLSRPSDHLSVALMGRNLNARAESPFLRSYEAAVGLRPFDERLTLGVDYRFGDAGPSAGSLAYTVQANVWRGLHVSAGASHSLQALGDLAFHLGLRVDFGRVGLWSTGGMGPQGGAVTTGVRFSAERYPSLPLPGGKVVLVDLADRLRQSNSTVGTLLGMTEDDPFVRTIEFLDRAAKDPELTGVLLKLDKLPDVGLAKVHELREALLRLRTAGKRVSAVLMTVNDAEYLLASIADEIFALPQSFLAVNGLVARSSYVGEALEKLDVKIDVARVGDYKTAPETFTRMDMSPAQRESVEALLDTQTRALEGGIQSGRRLDAETLRAAFSHGLISPQRAKELRLVDDVITTQALEKRFEKQYPGTRYEARYRPGTERDLSWNARRRIAVIPVLGSIDGGKSRRAPLGGEAIAGAETVVRAIQDASDDPRVVAIVLRVDSPGGGILPSDLMYRAALAAREKKPVIASMGDVAASGGYYVSMAADEIFASPTTITGSIGVFMIKPAFEGLLAKAGIRQEAIQRHEGADILNLSRPWTESEQSEAQRWVNVAYDDFIGLVAERRRLDKARVDDIARGRVWSGEDAKARGLVDSFGGLYDAIQSARKRANIPDAEELALRIYGEPGGFLQAPGGEEGVLAPLLALPVPSPDTALQDVARATGLSAIAPWVTTPGIQARMELSLQVE